MSIINVWLLNSFLLQNFTRANTFFEKGTKMLRDCYCLDPVLKKFKSFFYCGANRQRELQTSRQDNLICTGARLKFFPFKLNCLLLVFFSKLLKSLR